MKKKKFYSTFRWKNARLEALGRDLFRCQYCRAKGRAVTATTVHHVVPLDENNIVNAYGLDNLISLCNACHESIHNRDIGLKLFATIPPGANKKCID